MYFRYCVSSIWLYSRNQLYMDKLCIVYLGNWQQAIFKRYILLPFFHQHYFLCKYWYCSLSDTGTNRIVSSLKTRSLWYIHVYKNWITWCSIIFFKIEGVVILGWGGIGCKWKWRRDMILCSYNVQILVVSRPFTFKHTWIFSRSYTTNNNIRVSFTEVHFQKQFKLIYKLTINKGENITQNAQYVYISHVYTL